MRNRLASSAVALLLVLSAVGGGLGPASVTQTASAEWAECNLSDSLIGAAYNTITGADEGCRWVAGDSTDYENVTKTDAYADLLGIKDSAASYTTTVGNFQENSRSVAYTKGKIAVVKALENESTVSQAKNDANQSVRDYYARQEADIVADYNAKLTQLWYNVNASQLSVYFSGTDNGGVAVGQDYPDSYDWELQNTTYNLVNGTTVSLTTVVKLNSNGDSVYRLTFSEVGNITANDPATAEDDKETLILNPQDYKSRLSAIETQQQQVVDNMDQYADGVFSQYQSGELNATTLYQNDPTLLATEATTSFNSTGYYGYASAQLASIGYGGDLNQSHVVQINGANYTGTLFYSGAGGTEFQTGQTYDFANYSGTFYMAASDTPQNETGIIRLDDRGSSFTIVEATNTQTGESVNSTTTQKYVYESANASNLQQEIDRLEELREYYENQSAGGGGFNFNTEDKALLGVLGVAVILLLTRN